MTSFSGTELSLRKQIGISGVRAASLSIIFFSILFRHGITDVTLHCNFCVHRFIYDSVRSCRLHDLSTRRGRRREREKEGGKEKEREKSFRYPFLTPAIKMLLPPSNKYLFTSCYIFHLTAFDQRAFLHVTISPSSCRESEMNSPSYRYTNLLYVELQSIRSATRYGEIIYKIIY